MQRTTLESKAHSEKSVSEMSKKNQRTMKKQQNMRERETPLLAFSLLFFAEYAMMIRYVAQRSFFSPPECSLFYSGLVYKQNHHQSHRPPFCHAALPNPPRTTIFAITRHEAAIKYNTHNLYKRIKNLPDHPHQAPTLTDIAIF